jgi:hypothetical protein
MLAEAIQVVVVESLVANIFIIILFKTVENCVDTRTQYTNKYVYVQNNNNKPEKANLFYPSLSMQTGKLLHNKPTRYRAVVCSFVRFNSMKYMNSYTSESIVNKHISYEILYL